MNWYQLWQSVSGTWAFIGWGWASRTQVARFNDNCSAHHIRLLDRPPGSFWEQFTRSRSPTYVGSPAWYHVWDRKFGDNEFLGYLYVGYHTARNLKARCQTTDVLTRHGQAI